MADLPEPVDCIVLGRKVAQGFIPHWVAVVENPDGPEFEAGQKFTATPKGFSKHAHQAVWSQQGGVATGELTQETMALKRQPGQDIMAYGGSGFVSALLQAGLTDEFYLFDNPTAISSGLSFHHPGRSAPPQLRQATAFDWNIVVLHYAARAAA